jgi:DNA modification methylase/ParB-like chromosome segregation protein Spo0J
MEFHSIANIFPMLDSDSLSSLASDIKSNGLKSSILVYEGAILDGRNRFQACQAAGVLPRFETFSGTLHEALSLVWSLNFQRRHLNSSQAAIADAKRKTLDDQYNATVTAIAEAKRERPENARPTNEVREQNKSVQLIVPIKPKDTTALTDHYRATAAGTNRTYIKQADDLVKAGRTDLIEQIEKGKLTISQAKMVVKREEKLQDLERAAQQSEEEAIKEDSPKWSVLNVDVYEGLDAIASDWPKSRLIFADPPYNIGIDYGNGKKTDSLKPTDYMAWVDGWITRSINCLTDDGSLWVMIGDEYAAEYGVLLKSKGLTIRNWIKWYETFGVNCAEKFNRTSRHIFYCVRDPKNFIFNAKSVSRPSDRQTKYNDKRANPAGKVWDDVWMIPRLTQTCNERVPEFPTQLPLDLVSAIVECASIPGDLIIDPFNGSGTTGVAALSVGRKYIGIELNERYASIADKRLKGCIQ